MVTAHVCLKSDFLRICDQYDYELAQLFNPNDVQYMAVVLPFSTFIQKTLHPKHISLALGESMSNSASRSVALA